MQLLPDEFYNLFGISNGDNGFGDGMKEADCEEDANHEDENDKILWSEDDDLCGLDDTMNGLINNRPWYALQLLSHDLCGLEEPWYSSLGNEASNLFDFDLCPEVNFQTERVPRKASKDEKKLKQSPKHPSPSVDEVVAKRAKENTDEPVEEAKLPDDGKNTPTKIIEEVIAKTEEKPKDPVKEAKPAKVIPKTRHAIMEEFKEKNKGNLFNEEEGADRFTNRKSKKQEGSIKKSAAASQTNPPTKYKKVDYKSIKNVVTLDDKPSIDEMAIDKALEKLKTKPKESLNPVKVSIEEPAKTEPKELADDAAETKGKHDKTIEKVKNQDRGSKVEKTEAKGLKETPPQKAAAKTDLENKAGKQPKEQAKKKPIFNKANSILFACESQLPRHTNHPANNIFFPLPSLFLFLIG